MNRKAERKFTRQQLYQCFSFLALNCSDDTTIPCSSGIGCVNETAICDGIVDCQDFSDEFGCGMYYRLTRIFKRVFKADIHL